MAFADRVFQILRDDHAGFSGTQGEHSLGSFRPEASRSCKSPEKPISNVCAYSTVCELKIFRNFDPSKELTSIG
jgi:hypothetical protein